jgi:AcrR family transcriptional regulator
MRAIDSNKEVHLIAKSIRAASDRRPRERLLEAAYDLFSTNGVNQVGIDTILSKSGCAKASLYSNFNSKLDLAIAFLDRREAVWTRGWLETEIKSRATKPEGQLLAIFDVFDGWFRKKSFEGCSFINVLMESKVGTPVHRAAAAHLAKIRGILRNLAKEANLQEPEKFAQTWQILMTGSIVSAREGNRNAAREAKCTARLVLDNWKRQNRRSRSHRSISPNSPQPPRRRTTGAAAFRGNAAARPAMWRGRK